MGQAFAAERYQPPVHKVTVGNVVKSAVYGTVPIVSHVVIHEMLRKVDYLLEENKNLRKEIENLIQKNNAELTNIQDKTKTVPPKVQEIRGLLDETHIDSSASEQKLKAIIENLASQKQILESQNKELMNRIKDLESQNEKFALQNEKLDRQNCELEADRKESKQRYENVEKMLAQLLENSNKRRSKQ